MQKEIVNPYSAAHTYRESPCKQPFSRESFVRLCEEGMQHMSRLIEAKSFVRESAFAIFALKRYLDSQAIAEIVPDERFFESFRNVLLTRIKNKKGKLYGLSAVRQITPEIRRIINEYFFPRGFVTRPILEPLPWKKYQRFFSVSPLTQELIIRLEKEGRHVSVEKMEASDGRRGLRPGVLDEAEELTTSTKQGVIQAIFLLLAQVRRNGIEQVNSQDVQDYLRRAKLAPDTENRCKTLERCLTAYGNALAWKICTKNIFDGVRFKSIRSQRRIDYISFEDVRKLQDIDRLRKEVKTDRSLKIIEHLMTLFFLDSALRSNELGGITLEMLREIPNASTYHIILPGFVQKKGRKGEPQEKSLFLHRYSTVWLLRYYLNVVRPKLKARTQHLFISPLTRIGYKETGIRMAVRRVCERFNIRTIKGRRVFPHILRHTALTVQADELTPFELQDRARHADQRTTEIYRHEQTRLKRAKEMIEKDRQRSVVVRLDEDLVMTFFEELKSYLGTDGYNKAVAAYRDCREIQRYGREGETDSGTLKELDEVMNQMMGEKEALGYLKRLGLNKRAFRKYCLLEQKARLERDGETERYFYNRGFVKSLAEDYWPKETVFEKYPHQRTKFYEDLKYCRRIQIGHRLLVHHGDAARILLPKTNNLPTGNRLVRHTFRNA